MLTTARSFLLAAIVTTASLWFLTRRSPGRPDPRDLAKGVGTAAVPTAEELQSEWAEASDAQTLELWRRMVADAQQPAALVLSGDTRWIDMLAALEDPHFVSDQRIACGHEHGRGIQGVCAYHLRMVVERELENTGRIVYASVERATPDEELRLELFSDPLCLPYLHCLAAIRLGRSIPMPEGTPTTLAIQQSYTSRWVSPSVLDPEQLRTLADAVDKDVEARSSTGTATAEEALKVEKLRRQARYFREKAANLEESR